MSHCEKCGAMMPSKCTCRKITPHKGGRGTYISGFRVTDKEHDEIMSDYKESGASSFADYVLLLVRGKDDDDCFRAN